MKKKFEYTERIGLPGGPNEYITHVSGIFSTEGYKRNSPDVNNPYNIIPSGNITMKGVDFPVMGTDNLGNTKAMIPGNDYNFPGDVVFETPLAKYGGGLLTKTMKCNSCGWKWKAADGGNDVSTCHKCGGEAAASSNEFQSGGEYNPDVWGVWDEPVETQVSDNTTRVQTDLEAFTNIKPKPVPTPASIKYTKGYVPPKPEQTYEEFKEETLNQPPLSNEEKLKQQVPTTFEAPSYSQNATLSEYTPPSLMSKGLNRLANPLTTLGYYATGELMPDMVEDKGNPHDMALEVANPFAWLDYARQSYNHTQQGNYGMAGLTALGAIPALPFSGKQAKVAIQNTFPESISKIGFSKNNRERLGTLVGIPPERSLPRLSSEELKIYRQVQDIGKMGATNKPISEQYRYALGQNIPDEHFKKVFGMSKSEVEQILPSVAEQDAIRSSIPIRERFNLERAPRRRSSSDIAIDEMNSQVNRDGVIRDMLTARGRGRTIIPNQQNPRLSLKETAINDWQRYVDNKVPTSKVVNDKLTNIISEYPYYQGSVSENVPSLSLSSSGSLKNVSNKVTSQSNLGINSGDVFTGSLNTSHSSYLPQLKQVFKYQDGSPQFLGYKRMNHLGFLSNYNYSNRDIAKYLNTEIDTQIKRGIIPNDIQRPYIKNNNLLLPQYGIKQKQYGGEETNPSFDSWYSRYAKATGNSTNPYDKEHYYDYESFFNDNINNPENLYPLDTRDWHLSSKYKKEGHPRLYEYPDGTYGENYIEGAKDTREFQTGGSALPTAQFGGATTQDSLDLYNKNLASMKILESQGFKREDIDSVFREALEPSQVSNTLNIKNQIQKEIDYYKNYLDSGVQAPIQFIKSDDINDYYRREGKLTGANDWYAGGGDNIGDPMMWVHDNIKPRKHVRYIKELENHPKIIDGPYYDPVRIYPKSVGPVPREAYKYSEEFDIPDDITKSVVDVDKLAIIKQPYIPNLSTDWGAVLRSEGKDGSYGSRKKMYNDMGLAAKYGEYKGSANQNLAALNNYKNPTSNSVQTQPVQQEVISQQPKKEFSRYVNIHGKNYGFNTAEEFIDIAKRKNLPQGWIEANIPKNLESQTKESIAKFQTGGEYIVKSGDTFDGIANKKGINKDEFRKANPGISYDNIKINQKLNIPISEPKEYKTFAGKLAMENLFAPDKSSYDEFNKIIEPLKPALEPIETLTAKAIGLDNTGILKSSDESKLSKDLIFNEKFEKYKKDLINQENAAKEGYDPEKKLWFPHEAPEKEGGFDIGYGHKIKKGEDFSKGLTDQQVNDLLTNDLNVKIKSAKNVFDNENLNRKWDELNLEEKILLTDYQYNVGLTNFPKFIKALANKDKETMLEEYLRYSDGEPLGKRNDWTKSYIDTNLNYKTGGQLNDLKIYSDYINGNYDDIKFEKEAQKVYDKLNRIHYKNAKQFGMSAPNYIMTYLLKNPNG